MVPVTVAGCARRKRATTAFRRRARSRTARGRTLRKPSVSFTQNARSMDDCRLRSSVAFTTQRQRPSGASARLRRGGGPDGPVGGDVPGGGGSGAAQGGGQRG